MSEPSQHTQHQPDHEQQTAQSLSLQKQRPPGQALGYQPESFLGAGAFGEVWVGTDQNTGRKVAIKFFTHRSGVDWALLSREVEKLVFLSADRYVVQLLDVGWDAQPPYYVMDYIENGSLEDYLNRKGTLPVEEAVEIIREVAVGLMHLHLKGVLHCDLKPANVLLDEDHKPRLADFGQSRLSNEQSPALGTLFYMAPEQADLTASPDARWDVYALGALLYRMLTGQPPYKSDEVVHKIDTASDLRERLQRYRQTILQSPPPRDHRRLPGVGRPLAEIIEGALAADPRRRFPSVQSVLEALRQRDRQRARRPLVVLGLVGPLLLLAVVSAFGGLGYRAAMRDSDQAVIQRVRQSNEYAAKFVAANVARDIERHFHLVEQTASDVRLRNLMQQIYKDNNGLQQPLEALASSKGDPPPEHLAALLNHSSQNELMDYVSALMADTKETAASWVTTDFRGTHLADAFLKKPQKSPVGKNFAYRTYFTGEETDRPRGSPAKKGQHVQSVYLSPVFRSTATNTWKVAVSCPVKGDQGQFLGIIAVTIEMGRFAKSLRGRERTGAAADHQHFAVLVGGRAEAGQGVILQHPLFDEILKNSDKLPIELSKNKYHITHPALFPALNAAVDETSFSPGLYKDPLGKAPGGQQYDRPWVTAAARVKLQASGNGSIARQSDTGLVVLVQEDYQAAILPVRQLGRRLLRHAIYGAVVVALVFFLIWIFVARMLVRDRRRLSARSTLDGGSTPPTPLHKMETVSARKGDSD